MSDRALSIRDTLSVHLSIFAFWLNIHDTDCFRAAIESRFGEDAIVRFGSEAVARLATDPTASVGPSPQPGHLLIRDDEFLSVTVERHPPPPDR